MKSLKIYFPLLCFVFFAAFASAQQTGKIAGKIIDKLTGNDLIGVTVQVEGAGTGAISDIEGRFQFSLQPGTYTIVANYISYKTEKVSVEVKANEIAYLNLAMQESSTALEEVVVTYAVKKTTALALLVERKNAAVVSDGVSAELIRRTPDRSASDVLKRVTGASIQEGKFAVVRGMNDRYNAGYLDAALLPSTESDRKAFAFDVVPASLIDNLQIIKAGSPDMTGDFGGGIIRINTKAVPETFTQSLSIGGQMHSLTTFKGFTGFKKYPGESLGLVGNQRNLPNIAEGALKSASLFPNAEQKNQLAEASQGFNHDWSSSNINAVPNARFSYALGFPLRFSDDKKMGIVLALNYAATRRYAKGSISTFDGSGQTSALTDQIFSQNITSGGIFNLSYVAAKTQINFRNLLNINSDHNMVLRTGTGDILNAIDVQNTAMVLNSNRLASSVLSLKQVVGNKLFTLSASANYANVRRRIPDYRIASYTKTPDDEAFRLTLGDFFNTSTGRFSSDLKENLYGANFELGKDLNTRSLKTTLKLGASLQVRDRSFYGRSFVYNGNQPRLTYNPAEDLSAENIAGNKLYLVEKTADDLAYYEGKQRIDALYAMADQRIFENLRAVYGLRHENADIRVSNEKIDADIANIQEQAWLPSVNLAYSISEKTNLRAAYYASVNRPEFRELAPFAFYTFDKNAEIRGNRDLKIARLNNFDLRWEFFPTGNQVVSVGAFYKTIANPVEFSFDPTQVATTFTFTNEKSAKVYGVELEARKNLDFLGSRPIWSDITLFSNIAVIRSKILAHEGSLALNNRPLQGQSPYVFNAGIQYESREHGWFGSIVANRIGRRIAFVGVDPVFGDTRQDIYEASRTVLDVQLGKNIGKFNLKCTLGDLLRQNLLYYQDADHNGYFSKASPDRTMFQFTNGFTLSLSAGVTF